MLAIYTFAASLRRLIEAQVTASAPFDRGPNACFIVSGLKLALSHLIILYLSPRRPKGAISRNEKMVSSRVSGLLNRERKALSRMI
jgi:hypothetical protein